MIAFLMGMFFSTQAADHVKGNGKLSTKKITIDDFNAIKFDGVIDFNYEQSESTPHIEITVDENLHPDRKSTRLNSSHRHTSRMPSSA